MARRPPRPPPPDHVRFYVVDSESVPIDFNVKKRGKFLRKLKLAYAKRVGCSRPDSLRFLLRRSRELIPLKDETDSMVIKEGDEIEVWQKRRGKLGLYERGSDSTASSADSRSPDAPSPDTTCSSSGRREAIPDHAADSPAPVASSPRSSRRTVNAGYDSGNLLALDVPPSGSGRSATISAAVVPLTRSGRGATNAGYDSADSPALATPSTQPGRAAARVADTASLTISCQSQSQSDVSTVVRNGGGRSRLSSNGKRTRGSTSAAAMRELPITPVVDRHSYINSDDDEEEIVVVEDEEEDVKPPLSKRSRKSTAACSSQYDNDQLIAKLRSELADSKQEVADLVNHNHFVQTNMWNLVKEVDELKSRVERQEDEKKSLEAVVSMLEERNARVTEELDEARKQLDEEQTLREESETQVNSLANEISRLTSRTKKSDETPTSSKVRSRTSARR